MSQVSVASYQTVDDRELARAVARADVNCVNGLPDREAVGNECVLSESRIVSRLRDLEDRGHVAMHQTMRLDKSGDRSSYELLVDPDDIDPDARVVENPQNRKQYDAADCRRALREMASRVDGHLSQRYYKEQRDADHPGPKVIYERLGHWHDALADALEGDR